METDKRYNRLEEPLDDDLNPTVVDDSYLDSDGSVRWAKQPKNNEKYPDWYFFNSGFDIDIPRSFICLPKGVRFLRYGDEGGHCAAPLGTPYSKLAMPYSIRTCAYNEFEVTEDDKVWVVIQGRIAKQPAWKDELGGGIQYFFPCNTTIAYYVGRGLKKLEVSEWSPLLPEDQNHQ